MPTVYYGSREEPGFELEQSTDLIVIRTFSRRSVNSTIGSVPTPLSAVLEDGVLVASYTEAGVEIYRVPVGAGDPPLDVRKAAIRAFPDVQFAGGVLIDPTSRMPVLYTENIFIKFKDDADPDQCVTAINAAGLKIKRQVTYADNAYFVEAPQGTGQQVFDIAADLLQRDDVEFCHPELIRQRSQTSIYSQQWHLKKTTIKGVEIDAHANVESAHAITRGEGVTIAVIDDGVDIDHPEFGGDWKVVAPRDATLKTSDPRPKDASGTGTIKGENHGTACAGVACANGSEGASGVAPKARLMPIRLSYTRGWGSQEEADAFVWAADHGADVISCSWGPKGSNWWEPKENSVASPPSILLAINYATSKGRGGKGCVVLFSAGNGNETVDNKGYAAHSKVITVAACNDQGTRSVYSNYGTSVLCAFPSNDFGYEPFDHPNPLTPGIWTTDRTNSAGYNDSKIYKGDVAGNYTNSFGGTSSACPGAAGVVALMLSVNPGLKWSEVKELLKRSCDKIDTQGGNYDEKGHSILYGYGRLNALTAVTLARPEESTPVEVTGYATFKVTYLSGMNVRSGPGKNFDKVDPRGAVAGSEWQYKPETVFRDSRGRLWAEVKLKSHTGTGWVLVKDNLGTYYTDPKIDGPRVTPTPVPTPVPAPSPIVEYSSLLLTNNGGSNIRSKPIVDASTKLGAFAKNTKFDYRKNSVFKDVNGLVWAEVNLKSPIRGLNTAWLCVKDNLGNHYTDPKIDAPVLAPANSLSVSREGNWKFCSECGGVFFAGLPSTQCRSTGESHNFSNSPSLSLYKLTPWIEIDSENLGARIPDVRAANWAYCVHCQGLFHATSDAKPNECNNSATGFHQRDESLKDGNYLLEIREAELPPEHSYQECGYCRRLFNVSKNTVCHSNRGGRHEATGMSIPPYYLLS